MPPFARLAILCLLAAAPARAYIDMPAGKLTLPRLLIEFRSAGVFEVERIDPATGAVRYTLVDAVSGDPATPQKHALAPSGKLHPDLATLRAGTRVLLLGPDPYGRGLAFVGGTGEWYVTTYDRAGAWWRLAYTSSQYDFRCAHAGTDVVSLARACRALLDGETVPLVARIKPKEPATAMYSVSLRAPHRREASNDATAHPEPIESWGATEATTAQVIERLERSEPVRDRLRAAETLAARPADAARSVPALVKVLQSKPDPFLARACAVALGRLGPAAAGAIQALMDRFGGGGYEGIADLAGWEAVCAVRRIDPAGDRWLAEGAARLKSADDSHRQSAASAIGLIGPPARPRAVDLLLAPLRDKSPGVRYAAARALDRIEADPSGPVGDALSDLLADKDADVIDAARTSLRAMGPKAAPSVARVLGSPERPAAARRVAAQILSEMLHAAGAREALTAAAERDADADVRRITRAALARTPAASH